MRDGEGRERRGGELIIMKTVGEIIGLSGGGGGVWLPV